MWKDSPLNLLMIGLPSTLHDTRDVDLRGSELEVHFEINRQEQCLEELRAQRTENGEMIAERHACLTRDNRFKSKPLSLVRPLVDNDLALAVALRYLSGKYAEQRPIQTRERSVVEMTLNDGTDVGEVTIPVCRGLVELTTAAHGTITVPQQNPWVKCSLWI